MWEEIASPAKEQMWQEMGGRLPGPTAAPNVNFHDLSPSSKLMYSSPWITVSLPCRTVCVVAISISLR